MKNKHETIPESTSEQKQNGSFGLNELYSKMQLHHVTLVNVSQD